MVKKTAFRAAIGLYQFLSQFIEVQRHVFFDALNTPPILGYTHFCILTHESPLNTKSSRLF